MKRLKRMKAYLIFTVLLGVFILPGCGGDWDKPSADPSVSSTVPANNATGVAIGNNLTATFSEEMDSTTISATTFSLMQDVTDVPGTVTYSGVTAVFSPTNPLAADTVYTATITIGATDLDGNALAGDYVWSFTTGLTLDAIAPTVTSTVPLDLATGVATNSAVTATFNEAMEPATISIATFTVKETVSGTNVAGSVSLVGTTATFTPTNLLAADTNYTATVTTGAQDLAGNALAADEVWSFITSAVLDIIAPLVTSTAPLDLATGVATNSAVTATFNEAMESSTISTATFTVKETVSGTDVSGNVSLVGTTATFTPTNPLAAGTDYTATITMGAQDLAGNALAADEVWSFTTSAVEPTIISTYPMDQETVDISDMDDISATFSVDMDESTLTFMVQESGTPLGLPIEGVVTYDALTRTASFVPTAPLEGDTEYTVTMTSDAKDLAGNSLVVPAVDGLPVPNPWTFTTEAVIPPVEPLAINLGSAASFGIASRAGLTSTGVTVVNGDVALSPQATCADATGGPGGSSQTCLVQPVYATTTGMTVTGSIYWAADPFDSGLTADTVTTDLNNAWIEGMAKVNTQLPVAADELGGKTFIPGVYENANLTLSAGLVATLDAQNDANAIFIFKTTLGGDLIDSGTLLLPSRIELINGAQARNVWFVIGRDVTIGSGTIWNGNILANRTATILDGSTVTGRVLGGAGGAGAISLTGAASPSVTTVTVPE